MVLAYNVTFILNFLIFLFCLFFRVWWCISEQWAWRPHDVRRHHQHSASAGVSQWLQAGVWHLSGSPAAVAGCGSHHLQNEVSQLLQLRHVFVPCFPLSRFSFSVASVIPFSLKGVLSCWCQCELWKSERTVTMFSCWRSCFDWAERFSLFGYKLDSHAK